MLGLEHATAAALGPEVDLSARADRRRTYRWLTGLGLAVAALVVAGAGIVVLRRTTPS